MHHHHHHYTSGLHHQPMPHRQPPPPPPPPPPEAFETDIDVGIRPRCYYCGQAIAREEDVRKTEHVLGHGYSTMVMICPECRGKKERGEGVFATSISAQTIFSILIVAAVIGIFLFFWLPGFLESRRRHDEFNRQWEEGRRKHEEFRKKFDEEWDRWPGRKP